MPDPLSVQYGNLARQYYDQLGSLTPYPHEDTNNVWSYDAHVGLVGTAVPTAIFNEVMALKLAAKELTGSKGVSEGSPQSSWLLCDFDSVVVHILTEDAREFYALDDLWADAEEVFPAA